ncbi:MULTISPECIES: oxidoreductase [Clostridium]|uniref:tRNA-dihydrouridine synthase n=1 Tax=Clostridium frigoriphilum TaxID=443253 RepID=A0ABU7UW53_9CLOT|nr:tRNA-dihydrouridine synthase [Clostridium sp. DSM 17811]MBU3101725.1 tRNA-dihydrouridine synthase [Clostridium sp. DSM 17811]
MLKVFNPFQINNIFFRNRIVMAPMVRFGFPSYDGIMGEELMQDYLSRADKGIGLIVTQALSVSADSSNISGSGTSGGAGAFSDRHINYLNRITEEYHKNGTRIFAQLSLPGYGFYDRSSMNINILSKKDLIKIRNEFVRSAEICKKAGMDGIELHGAHTFFLNMMASSNSNLRQDDYGGTLAKRLSLVKEIVEGIKSLAGSPFIISYRMGWGSTLDMDVQTALALENMGIDMLHISTGIPQDRKLVLPTDFTYNDTVYTGYFVKNHVNLPIICVSDIKTLERGNTLIENNDCDFIAYGRPFLADANFVGNSLDNINYKPCFECRVCKWLTNSKKCPAQIISKTNS